MTSNGTLKSEIGDIFFSTKILFFSGLALEGIILRATPLPPTLWWGRCPLGVDMTLWEEILGGQNWGPWGFSGPGPLKKRFPGKNDVE